MDVARLRGTDCNAAFELLVNDGEQVSPLNTYSVVACFAPMAVELATEYDLNGYRVWRALQASRTRLPVPVAKEMAHGRMGLDRSGAPRPIIASYTRSIFIVIGGQESS